MLKKKSVSFGTSTDENKSKSTTKMKDVDLSAVSEAMALLEEVEKEKAAEKAAKKETKKQSSGCGCW